MYAHHGLRSLLMMSIVSLLLSVFLINLIRFPFKAPDETMRRVSLDRFFLVHGTPCFSTSYLLRLLSAHSLHPADFSILLDDDGGFMLAILSEKIRLCQCRTQERVGGRLSVHRCGHPVVVATSQSFGIDHGIGAMRLWHRHHRVTIPAVLHQVGPPLRAGHLAEHLLLGLGDGLAMGLAGGWLLADKSHALLLALVLVAVALVLYNNVIHPWYLHIKTAKARCFYMKTKLLLF
jgi:hypothetical protein